MGYRIGTVAKLTGISRNTITAWERRYGLIRPEKDASGYRVYTDAQVELLRRVKALIDGGYQIREAIELAGGPLQSASENPGQDLQSALMAFDRDAAERVHAEIREWSFRERIDTVYLPILRDTGMLWAEGRATVAQEHFVSGFIREKLIGMLEALESGPRGGPHVVCAGFPGDLHELGLLAVAVHLALRGHRVTWLGANLPFDALVEMLCTNPTDVVCLSLIRDDIDDVIAQAQALRRQVAPGTLIVIGGPGTSGLEEHSLPGLLFCPRFDDLLVHWDEIRTRTLRVL